MGLLILFQVYVLVCVAGALYCFFQLFCVNCCTHCDYPAPHVHEVGKSNHMTGCVFILVKSSCLSVCLFGFDLGTIGRTENLRPNLDSPGFRSQAPFLVGGGGGGGGGDHQTHTKADNWEGQLFYLGLGFCSSTHTLKSL